MKFGMLLLCALLCGTLSPAANLCASDPGNEPNVSEKPSDSDLYGRAEDLFKQKAYQEVVRILSGPASDQPGNFKMAILLSKAELKECERLKADGDATYRVLVHKPYNRAALLLRIDKRHPEPYFIAAQALVINQRPQKALSFIRKALYFKPNNPEYLMVQGDAYAAQGEGYEAQRTGEEGNHRDNARDAYRQALKSLGGGQEELRQTIELKLKKVGG
jgi:predicted Zn-dependent protease